MNGVMTTKAYKSRHFARAFSRLTRCVAACQYLPTRVRVIQSGKQGTCRFTSGVADDAVLLNQARFSPLQQHDNAFGTLFGGKAVRFQRHAFLKHA